MVCVLDYKTPSPYYFPTLTSPHLQDSGEYTCTASNKWGMSYSVTLTLLVEYTLPNVTLEYEEVPVGRDGELVCRGTGHPLVDLSLTINGEEVTENVTRRVVPSSPG